MTTATASGGGAPSGPPDKAVLAEEAYFNQPPGFPFNEFRLEEVQLPPGDDLGVVSEDDDVAEEATENLDTGFGSSLAIDGLPIIGEDKLERLVQVLRKKCLDPHGEVKSECLWMPQDESGNTKGYAFVEFSKRPEAVAAQAAIDNFKFDKAHKLRAYLIDTLDKLEKTPEEYEAPPAEPFDEQTYSDTMAWMLDKRGRDQFLVQHGQDAQQQEVFWNDAKKGEPELFYSKSFWSEGPLAWSPLGTYAASLHRQGAVLWASAADGTFRRVARFPCPGVQKVDFSAHEELVTCYSVAAAGGTRGGGAEAPQILMTVFDCRSSRKLRTLQDTLPNLLVGEMQVNARGIVEPFLRWSPVQPALAAKLAPNAVQVYDGTDGMVLLGKQSLRLEGVAAARWSPVDNILAVFQAEHADMPARASIIALPERVELRQKNLFNVTDATLAWHPQGTFLAFVVEKSKSKAKAKKGGQILTSIELFSLRGAASAAGGSRASDEVTNDVLELPTKGERVLCLAWEPRGERFAFVHGEGARRNVSFYTMAAKSIKEGAKLLGTVTNKAVSQLHWSPAGRNILLAALDQSSGLLEFFNVDDMATLRCQQHYQCNNVKWDATGRYVASWVDDTRDMDHGYIVWSFTGEMMYRCRFDSFTSFAWRPRPPSLLPAEKEREIARNLKAYSKRYEEEDELLLAAADTELVARRAKKKAEWEEYVSSKAAWLRVQEEHLAAVLGRVPAPPRFTLAETDVQQVVEVKEEPFAG